MVAQAFLPEVGLTYLSVDVRLRGDIPVPPKPHMLPRQAKTSGRLGGRKRPRSPARRPTGTSVPPQAGMPVPPVKQATTPTLGRHLGVAPRNDETPPAPRPGPCPV